MSQFMLELRQGVRQSTDDVLGLQGYLAPLVGEPFRLARVSYGDELTLHFGDLHSARSPKLQGYFYGAFILGVRGSAWIIKSGSEPLVVAAGLFLDSVAADLGKPLSKQDIEKNPIILPTPPEADEPGDELLPELADWELLSPRGLLSAWPGLQWSFKPSAGNGSAV